MSCPCENCSQTTTTTLNCTPVDYCVDGCPDILDSKCVVYKGDDLDCTEVETNDTLEEVIAKLDEAICGITNDTDDKMVRISSADTTSGYLETKLIAGDYILLDKLNTGLNESIQVNVDYASLSGLLVQTPLVVTSTDNTVFFAQSGTANHTVNLKVNVAPDAGNLIQVYSGGLYVQASETHKVMSNNLDGIPDYLESKIFAGSNITLTSVPYTDGVNNGYKIRIDAATSTSPNLVVSSPDSSVTIVQGGTQGHTVSLTTNITADNGLTKTLNNIQLGGDLVQDTSIDCLNYNFNMLNGNSINLQNVAGSGLTITPTDTGLSASNNVTLDGVNIFITSSVGNIGLTAQTELALTGDVVSIDPASGTLTIDGLPNTTLGGTDKVLLITALDEVKTFDLASYITSSMVTASNGLTKASNNIKLGGTLTEITTVNTTGYTINFSKATNTTGNQLGSNHTFTASGTVTSDSSESFYGGSYHGISMMKTSNHTLHASSKMGASIHNFYFAQSGDLLGTGMPGVVSVYSQFGDSGDVTQFAGLCVHTPMEAGGYTYSGTITDYYGIYLADIAGSDIAAQISKPHGIYQMGDSDNRFEGSVKFAGCISANSDAGDPTTTDIPAGRWIVWKNSSTGDIKVWYNDSGVLKSTAAFT
jgi:hypothetical protein